MKHSSFLSCATLLLATQIQAAKPAPPATPAPATPPAAKVAPAPAVPAPAPVTLNALTSDDKYRFSYAIGLDVAQGIQQLSYDLDMGLLIKGILDGSNKDTTRILMSPDDRKLALEALSLKIQEIRAQKDSIAAAENIAKGKTFLDKNKKVKGVVTTPSGLQYTQLKKGTGASPKTSDQVTVHYAGSLLDGSEFDSSIKRGEPLTFPLANVIKGWQELLPLMKVGEKVKCWIPSSLGYGEQGNPRIPANSVLVFEIELLGIGAPAAK